MGFVEPNYNDENEKVSHWAEMILNVSIPKSNIFLSKGRCECADLFYRYAPSVIR